MTGQDTHTDSEAEGTDDEGGLLDEIPLSRRDAILAGAGLGGLSLLGSRRARADHKHPVTEWNRHQSAQGEYTLNELEGLNMAEMDHNFDLHDFEGSGLDIEEEAGRNRLTVDFGEGDLDRRYLSWDDDVNALDFSGAAEWENEVDDFTASGSPNTAGGTASVVGGGEDNEATGSHSTIPGGQDNSAGGDYSLAAGEGADAADNGSFVWATGGDSSRGQDSVLFQAAGGTFVADGNLDVEDGDVGVENDITARTGDVTADSGDVTADQNVTARNGDVTASDGSLTAEDDVTANTGDVTADSGNVDADQNVTAGNNVEAGNDVIATHDVLASGNVEGNRLIANTSVDTDTVSSSTDLTLDVSTSDEVISETDLRVEGDLHVTGTKHFSTAVDTPAGPKQVTYTSVEAGKPRTEASDVAELTDGRAQIDLPDHFAMVTSEDEPITVQVTPYAREQVHPQVVDRSRNQIVIEDMGDGPKDYTIAYTVKGVRKGYENEPVVRDQ